MVKVIKKMLLEFTRKLGEEFYNDKKVLTIAKEDNDIKDRDIYYIQSVMGSSRYTKKMRINRFEYKDFIESASKQEVIKTY